MKTNDAASRAGYGLFSDSAQGLKGRIVLLYAILAAANIGAWAWAFFTFRDYPVQLGTAFLAYTFGLRHAVDAVHIAAIDNVTRKLMQEGKRPAAAGFFFSLGHSTIVWLGSIVIALAATAFKDDIENAKEIGGIAGTLVSASFLLLIAVMNIFILAGGYKTFRHVKAGGAYSEEDLDLLLGRGGFLARIFRHMFRLISRSWHMYPLGFLFGLGFDTATEIGVLGIAAAQASKGLPIWSIMVFPALFTAGMSLVDTSDGFLMVGAYGWAFLNPLRKLYYNLTITGVSVIVAVVVGVIEALGLVAEKLGLTGGIWSSIDFAAGNFTALGYLVVGIFIASWLVSFVIYRVMGYSEIGSALPMAAHMDGRRPRSQHADHH